METGESLDPFQAILHDILRQDSVAVLLKAHTWTEVAMRELLAACVTHPAADKLKYPAILDILVALEAVPTGLRPCYRKLNDQRNEIAHVAHARVDEKMMNDFINTVPKPLRSWLRDGRDRQLDRYWRTILYHMANSLHERAFVVRHMGFWMWSPDHLMALFDVTTGGPLFDGSYESLHLDEGTDSDA